MSQERADLFRCYDAASSEVEYLELLGALVRCLKPEMVLETGAGNGYGTIALAAALRENCIGHLVSLEADAAAAERVRDRLCDRGLHNAVVHAARSIDYLATTSERFGFAFLDSELGIRVQEMRLCVDRGLLGPGAVVAIHDTSRHRIRRDGQPDPASRQFWVEFDQFRAERALAGSIEFPYSRGLLLIRC